MSALGTRIGSQRMCMGLRQADLAAAAGVGVPFVSKVENGREVPSDATLTRIATAIELDPDELVLLAGRIPSQLLAAVRAHPQQALRLLRALPLPSPD